MSRKRAELPRCTLLRVAEALEELPALARALAEGTLHWSAAREFSRVAAPETEQEWLEVAQRKSVRQLEELVAGRRPGDPPTSPFHPSERRHVLRFEVAPETFALFREAMAALRRSSDTALDDDAALLAMARHVLGGPRDEGRSSYQIAITVCAECGRGHQPASGELVPIGSDIVEMAHCDGQHLGCLTPHAANDATTADGRDRNEGASASGVRFQHSDGSPYGQAENPQALDARAKAFAGLRNLGFREGDVRTVLGKLRDEGELAAATTEQWLRAALGLLTTRCSRI